MRQHLFKCGRCSCKVGLLSYFHFLSAFCALSRHLLKDPYTSAIPVLHILEYGKFFARFSKNADEKKTFNESRACEYIIVTCVPD